MYEFQKHKKQLLYEWLLEFAKKNGLPGGAAFRSISGYGHHGKIHEEHFFELASNVPIQVTFITNRSAIKNFFELLKTEKINLFYEISEVESGMISNE
jgi:PII-like signaling protein